jgi:hypothetical protein
MWERVTEVRASWPVADTDPETDPETETETERPSCPAVAPASHRIAVSH